MPLQEHIIDTPSSTPGKIFILLHGSGGNSDDIYDALKSNIRSVHPNAAIIAPQGQLASKHAGTAQHFEIEAYYSASLFEKDPSEFDENEALRAGYMVDEADRAASNLNNMIDSYARDLSVDAKDIHLIGYSQGGQLALHAGLGADKEYGSITSIFGNLLPLHKFKADNIQKPAVQLVSSEADKVVPKISIDRTENFLRSAGVSTYHDDSYKNTDHYSWIDLAKLSVMRLLTNISDNGGKPFFGLFSTTQALSIRDYKR